MKSEIVGFIIVSVVFALLGCKPKIIDGYTDKHTYFPGDEVRFYLNANMKGGRTLRLFDINGRVVDEFSLELKPQKPLGEAAYSDGFGYELSGVYTVPRLKPGLYSIEKKISFIVGHTSDNAQITFVYPTNTINAYNNSGGKSLYAYNSSDRIPAQKVSFLRPMAFHSYAISPEFLKFLFNQEEYSVQWLCDRAFENTMHWEGSKMLLIVGHSEYWTRKAREEFDEFVSSGGGAAVFSGNSMWWQVRYEDDLSTLVCHRTIEDDPIQDSSLLTINWHESVLNYPITESIGVDFNFGGYGDVAEYSGFNGFKIVADDQLFYGTDWGAGQLIKMKSQECDGVPFLKLNEDGSPLIDTSLMDMYAFKLLAYDIPYRDGPKTASFIRFRRTPSSGEVINFASTNVLSDGYDNNPESMQRLLKNVFRTLIEDSSD